MEQEGHTHQVVVAGQVRAQLGNDGGKAAGGGKLER